MRRRVVYSVTLPEEFFGPECEHLRAPARLLYPDCLQHAKWLAGMGKGEDGILWLNDLNGDPLPLAKFRSWLTEAGLEVDDNVVRDALRQLSAASVGLLIELGGHYGVPGFRRSAGAYRSPNAAKCAAYRVRRKDGHQQAAAQGDLFGGSTGVATGVATPQITVSRPVSLVRSGSDPISKAEEERAHGAAGASSSSSLKSKQREIDRRRAEDIQPDEMTSVVLLCILFRDRIIPALHKRRLLRAPPKPEPWLERALERAIGTDPRRARIEHFLGIFAELERCEFLLAGKLDTKGHVQPVTLRWLLDPKNLADCEAGKYWTDEPAQRIEHKAVSELEPAPAPSAAEALAHLEGKDPRMRAFFARKMGVGYTSPEEPP